MLAGNFSDTFFLLVIPFFSVFFYIDVGRVRRPSDKQTERIALSLLCFSSAVVVRACLQEEVLFMGVSANHLAPTLRSDAAGFAAELTLYVCLLSASCRILSGSSLGTPGAILLIRTAAAASSPSCPAASFTTPATAARWKASPATRLAPAGRRQQKRGSSLRDYE